MTGHEKAAFGLEIYAIQRLMHGLSLLVLLESIAV